MSAQEPTARPLTDRMMGLQEHRDTYVSLYRQAMQTILVPERLQRRVDELAAYIHDEASASDQQQLEDSAGAIKRYLVGRHMNVADELARY